MIGGQELRKSAFALACVLALALACGAGASAASVPAKKPPKKHVVAKKKPAKKAMCLIGQTPGGDHCAPNPLLAKTVCASFVPWLQALAPGFQFPAGYDHGAGPAGVDCWWTVNGKRQAFDVYVADLAGSSDQSGKKLTAQQAFDYEIQIETQSWDTPDEEVCPDGSKSRVPKRTTVEGYQAFTEDTCPADGSAGMVAVLVGPVQFAVHAFSSQFDLTSAELTPLVEQLIAKYKQYVPQG